MHLDSAVTFRDDDLIACVCGRTRPGRPARAAGRVRGGLTAAAVTGRGFLCFVSRAQAALATKARGAHFDEATDEPIRDRVAAGPGLPARVAPAASPRLDGRISITKSPPTS